MTHPNIFIASKDAIRRERHEMLDVFLSARAEITRLGHVLKKAYPLAVEIEKDNTNATFPNIAYLLQDTSDAENTRKACALRLAVVARPQNGPRFIADGVLVETPRLGLVLAVADKTYYAASLFQDRYELSEAGAYAAFHADLGAFCGALFPNRSPELKEAEWALLSPPHTKTFGNPPVFR